MGQPPDQQAHRLPLGSGIALSRPLPVYTPPPVPDLRRPPSPSPARAASPPPGPTAAAATPALPPLDVHRDPSLAAIDHTPYAPPTHKPETASARSLTSTVARLQVAVALALLVAAPLLALLAHKPSGIAFAVHGIGAMLVMLTATMAMHKAYPLLRGGARTWPDFTSWVGRLALVTCVQAASSLWLLHFYLHGPAQVIEQTMPAIDQLAMQFKVFGGLASMICFTAAWMSSRRVSGERGDEAVLAPVFALTAGWLCMIAALLLGAGISWVMPT